MHSTVRGLAAFTMSEGPSGRRRRTVGWLSAAALTGAVAVPALGVLPAASAAGSFTVNSTVDGHQASGDPVCETATGNGICTLRAAIEAANAAGGVNSIAFAAGVTPGTFTLSLGELHVTGSPAQTLTVTGGGQTMTVVDANNGSRGLEIDSGASVSVSGVTVKNGSVAGDGGGIRNAGTLMLSSSLISSNAVQATDLVGGGGISNTATGKATLDKVTIDNNTATFTGSVGTGTDGGGIETLGSLSFTNGTVSNNKSLPVTGGGFGGGISLGGVGTLKNLDVHDNSAGSGGGLSNTGPASIIDKVTLHANHATVGVGGGLADFGSGGDKLTNVTVDGNTAAGAGGGIADASGPMSMSLINDTIANNTAGGAGGGFISEKSPDTVKYTILSANTPTNCATASTGTIVSAHQNIDNGTSCGFSAPNDKPGTDPRLLALAANSGPDPSAPPTDALPANSPAVDFSPAGTCPPPTTDARGVTRPQGPACDSGAYELIQAQTVGKLLVSPVPIAASGSLKANKTVTVTVTAQTAGGVPLVGATVYLSFTPTSGGGSATTHKLTLTGSPQAVTTGKAGTISVTYHAPANPQPTSGTDTLTAANAATAPTVTATDTYTFAAVTHGVTLYTLSPTPIAATHTLAANATVTVTVIAKDSGGVGVPHALIYLSFVQATGGGSATALGHPLTSTPQLFKTDKTGAINVIYHTGATLPSTGTDTVNVANAPSGASVTGSDTYSF